MPDPRTPKSPAWLRRLGSRIRQARRSRGLTQTSLAQPDLTKSFISLLESGRTYPSVGTLVALSTRLQTSLSLLLLEEPQLSRETALNLLALARSPAPSATPATLLAAAEALAGEAEDLRVEVVMARGDVAVREGRLGDAGKTYTAALDRARRHRLRASEPRLLARLASIGLVRGDLTAAREQFEEALRLFRATRTLRSVDGIRAMLDYADLLGRLGRPARAMRILQEVARVAARQDLPAMQARAQVAIGRAHLAADRREPAAAAFRAARAALEAEGEEPEIGEPLQHTAEGFAELGQYQDAHTLLEQALRIAQRAGDARNQATAMAGLARIAVRLGKHEEANRHARAALELLRTAPDPPQRARLLVTMAEIARARRRWQQAIGHLKDAVEIFRRTRLQPELASAARELGMLYKDRGRHAEAAEYLAIALAAERRAS